ncbi:MAG TPA: L-histidine N(alpha)-methyltransferase [Candidatus Saccharimonadales bacterium]|nr:L-histidine N(alpha)-methyltransferase [Candidatus Saccharimonadales bacterium]
MPYFKHAELVNQYHVSLKTVHNWIDASKQGKLGLKLQAVGGRTYVADTPNNSLLLKELAEQGKKYRNTRHQATATPVSKFYDLFTRKQILDIINNISVHREIPRQYNYVGEGATRWDEYTKRLIKDGTPNLLENTVELLHANLGSVDLLLKGYTRVNVIDIGLGNALPVKDLLEHLLQRGILHRYIAIDISEEMLHIAERNINEWFGDKIKFEGHARDISFEHFDDVLVDDMLGKDAEKTINLVLLLGGTPANFRKPTDLLRTIHDSMGSEDLILYTVKPDSELTRRYFSLGVAVDGGHSLAPIHSYLFSLLNIDESMYTVERGYNEQQRVRFIRVRLNRALRLVFKFEDGERHIDLEKGDTILLWRAWHRTGLELISQFEKVGFSLIHSSMAKDRECLLTISGVDTSSDIEA